MNYVFDARAANFGWAAVKEVLRREGFVVLRNLFPPETIDYVADRSREILKGPAIGGSVGYYRKDYAKRLFDPLLLGGPSVDLVVHEGVVDMVEDYLDGECLLAELNVKHDDGVNEVYFPLHCDFEAGWKMKPHNVVLTEDDLKNPIAVGAMIYLHDTSDGAFCYCAGTHRLGAPHGTVLADYPSDERKRIADTMVRVEGRKGDLVLFDDRGFHGPEQPVPVSRTVVIFDYYKVSVFGRKTKTAIPVLLNDLSHLNERQLRLLGLGAGVMIPYSVYHTRRFSKSRHYRLVAGLFEAVFRFDHLEARARRVLRTLRGKPNPTMRHDV